MKNAKKRQSGKKSTVKPSLKPAAKSSRGTTQSARPSKKKVALGTKKTAVKKVGKRAAPAAAKRPAPTAKKSVKKPTRTTTATRPAPTKPASIRLRSPGPSPAKPGYPLAAASSPSSSSTTDAPRSFSPANQKLSTNDFDGDREDDLIQRANDLGLTPTREGADIVTPAELGEGEQVSSDLDAADADDEAADEFESD